MTFLTNHNVYKNGFTFLEVVIALFVFITGILGVYLIVQYPLVYINESADQLIASYLAQEGIEIVRNIRDENFLNKGPTRPWYLNLLGDNCKNGCSIDYICYSNPGSYEDTSLKFGKNLTSGYGYTYCPSLSHDTTIFKRVVTITPIPNEANPEYLGVKVEVSWTEKSKPHNVVLYENLYNWWPY